MKRIFYRELWEIRFKKMLALECDSVAAYQILLDECKNKYHIDSVVPHLERLIEDEKKHVLLVKELIDILNKNASQALDYESTCRVI
jgi:rubrerythrin